MYSLILIGVIALIILLCAGLAALFGFSKTKTNLVITIASAAVALGVCWLTKAVLPTADVMMAFVEGKMEWITSQFGANVAQIAAQALEFAAISPTLAELSIQSPAVIQSQHAGIVANCCCNKPSSHHQSLILGRSNL